MSPIAITAHAYPAAFQRALTSALDLDSDPVKLMLLTAYAFNVSHASIANVKAAGAELGAVNTGYTVGGIVVPGMSVTTAGLVTKVDGSDPSLVIPLGGSAAFAYVVAFDALGGTDATRYPFAYWDLGGTQTFNDTGAGSQTVTLAFDVLGILDITCS